MANIAFYTLGDARPAGDPIWFQEEGYLRVPTKTEIYRLRAASLVGPANAFGAETRAKAIEFLNGRDARSARKIFFVGHGSAGVFFFNGHSTGANGFTAGDSQCLHADPVDSQFLQAMLRVLAPAARVEIAFLCCFTGQFEPGTTDLMAALDGALEYARGNSIHVIGGFENYYQIGYQVDDEGRNIRFRDSIVSHDSNQTTLAQSSAVNGIPAFERTED